MTKKLYLTSNELESESTVIEVITEPFNAIVLDATLFHPQGGGQKGDRGTIGSVPIIDVKKQDDKVYHIIDDRPEFKINDKVKCSVDDEWRSRNSRLHTGGHLIASIVESIYPGFKAMKGHHWPNEARVEFSGTHNDILEFQETIQFEIDKITSNPVISRTEYNAEGVRVSIIGDFEATPCGGTHVDSTRELLGLKVTRVKFKKGVLKVSYEVL